MCMGTQVPMSPWCLNVWPSLILQLATFLARMSRLECPGCGKAQKELALIEGWGEDTEEYSQWAWWGWFGVAVVDLRSLVQP